MLALQLRVDGSRRAQCQMCLEQLLPCFIMQMATPLVYNLQHGTIGYDHVNVAGRPTQLLGFHSVHYSPLQDCAGCPTFSGSCTPKRIINPSVHQSISHRQGCDTGNWQCAVHGVNLHKQHQCIYRMKVALTCPAAMPNI